MAILCVVMDMVTIISALVGGEHLFIVVGTSITSFRFPAVEQMKHIYTNDQAEDKITYWIDDCLYQVQKVYGTREHQIVRLN